MDIWVSTWTHEYNINDSVVPYLWWWQGSILGPLTQLPCALSIGPVGFMIQELHFFKLFHAVYFCIDKKKICAEVMGSNLGTLDLKASTLSIWPLALLKNGTLSALPYDSNFECLKFYKSQNSKLTAKRYHLEVVLISKKIN